MSSRRNRLIAVAAVVGVVVALVVAAQLLLPGIARKKARDEIGDSSARVTIKASPTLKLLFGKADEVDVDTPTVAGTQEAPLGRLLKRAKDVGKIDATVGRIQVQGLVLRDLRAHVEDGRVDATTSLSVASLAAMVPAGGKLTMRPSGPDGSVRFAVTVGLLGIGATVDGSVVAADGAVQATAEGLPLPLSITVFADPSVAVDSVRGRADGDELRIAFSGRLT